MTPEERQALLDEKAQLQQDNLRLASAIGRPEVPLTTGEEFFGKKEGWGTAEGLEIKDFARLLVNAPSSAANIAGGLYDAAASPIETAKMLGSVGYGAILEGAELIAGEEEGKNEHKEAFELFINGLSESYGSLEALHKTIVQNPVGFLLDVSPLKSGVLSKLPGGIGRAMGKGTIRPVSGAAMLPGKVAGSGSKLVEGAGEFAGSLTTGMPGEVIGQAIGTSAEAAEHGSLIRKMFGRKQKKVQIDPEGQEVDPFAAVDDFKETLRQKGDDRNYATQKLLDDYDKAVLKINADAGEKIGRISDTLVGSGPDSGILRVEKTPAQKVKSGILDASGKPVTQTIPATYDSYQMMAGDVLKGIQRDFVNLLETKYRTTLVDKDGLMRMEGASGRLKGDIPGGEHASLNTVIDKLFDVRAGQDLKALHNMRVEIDTRFPRKGRPKQVATELRQIINDRFEKLSPEFAKASSEFSETKTLLDKAYKEFSGAARGSTRVGALLQTLKENATADQKRQIIDLIRKKTGYHLAAAASGSALSTWMPSGIHARNIALVGLGGLATGIISPATLLAFPLAVPRVVGELAHVLGYPIGAARKFAKFSEKLHAKAGLVPGLLDQGLNIGTIVERLLEEGIEPPPFPDFSSTEERLKKGIK